MQISIDGLETKKISVIVFLVSLGIGLVSFTVLYIIDDYSLLYYGDAVSHLYSARRILDSNDPGLILIGTVWLPVPHLMLAPFSMIDSLFSSGIAGLIVNLPLHALTAVLVCKIVNFHTNKKWIAIVMGLVYASNPNLIYLGITAMTEAPFLFFFVASAYYLQKWNQNNQVELKNVFVAASFVSLATLSRYEGWILAPALVLFVLYLVLNNKSLNNRVLIVIISLVAFSGILFWTSWNYVIYDDPLEFANSEFYSASSQATERPYRDFLYLQPHNVAYIYGMASFMILGPVLLVMGALGYYAKIKEKMDNTFFLFYLSLPVLFTLFTLFIGIGEMSQWWFNSRFATFLIPIVLVLASIKLKKISQTITKKEIMGITILGLFVFQLLTPTFGVVTFLDAYAGWIHKQSPYGVQASEFLKEYYDGGTILIITGSAQAHRIMISSGLSLTLFDEMIESWMYKPSYKEPWEYDRWIILGTEPDSDSLRASKYWQDNFEKLLEHYTLEYENKYYKILKIR